jgi:hypothetical protein
MQSRIERATRVLIAEGGRLSKYDLAQKVFCDQRTAQRILDKLHKANDCSVVDWVKVYKQWIPVYAAKRKSDKPKPKPLTKAESSKKFKKNHPDYVLGATLRRRAKRLMERIKCAGLSESQQRWSLAMPTPAPPPQSSPQTER